MPSFSHSDPIIVAYVGACLIFRMIRHHTAPLYSSTIAMMLLTIKFLFFHFLPIFQESIWTTHSQANSFLTTANKHYRPWAAVINPPSQEVTVRHNNSTLWSKIPKPKTIKYNMGAPRVHASIWKKTGWNNDLFDKVDWKAYGGLSLAWHGVIRLALQNFPMVSEIQTTRTPSTTEHLLCARVAMMTSKPSYMSTTASRRMSKNIKINSFLS